MIAKTEHEKEQLRTAGKMLSEVLHEVAAHARPGVTTAELNAIAEKGIRSRGASPVFLGYKSIDAKRPYPATLCASVNEEVVHGIPSEDSVLEEGDVVSLDLGLSYEGFVVDSALTIGIGTLSAEDTKLIDATREALASGVAAARAGGHIGDIGSAVEAVAARCGVTVVDELGGHATGKALHELPFIPNFGEVGEGERLPDGLVIAIEPIFSRGTNDIVLDPDGWTLRTADNSRAAHFEQTILITKDGSEILTAL